MSNPITQFPIPTLNYSNLPAVTGALLGDYFSVVQGGITSKETNQQVLNLFTANIPTNMVIPQPLVRGITTGAVVTTGNVGELLSIIVPQGTPVSLVTATPKTVALLNLTAGNWAIGGSCGVIGAGSTVFTQMVGCVSLTNNALSSSYYNSSVYTPSTTGIVPSSPLIQQYLNTASPTTIYLVIEAAFSVSTASGFGYLYAQRVS